MLRKRAEEEDEGEGGKWHLCLVKLSLWIGGIHKVCTHQRGEGQGTVYEVREAV